MDDPNLPEEVVDRVHRGLIRVHRWLGNTRAITRAIRRDPLPVVTVLDVGCGAGGMLAEIQRRLDVEVIGVDLRVPAHAPRNVSLYAADAVHDRLPRADVAFCAMLAHHLSEAELTAVIRNVSRSCRRFIILDLVRHRLPLALFRLFIYPFLGRLNALDGVRSIERAYTPAELRKVVARALPGSTARIRHTVAPFQVRQMIDITYLPE
ncbi:MAG: methyltransferase domain-containing protein [Bryobacteraceae bacterium]